MPLHYESNHLAHYGIKGQKWGVRRFQTADGSLTLAGIKRYAKKGYAQDEYEKRNAVGKTYDKYTGAHKRRGAKKYDISSKSENKDRAEKYVKDNTRTTQQKISKAVATGIKASKKMSALSVVDNIVYGGAGKRAAKTAVTNTGRAAVTAYVMARGGYDIRWYDKPRK